MKDTSKLNSVNPAIDETREKADLFYDYAVQIHKERLDRYRSVEDKSMKYLTILSVIITALVFILGAYKQEIFLPYKYKFMIWIVCIELFLVSLALCCAWGHILTSITINPLTALSSDGEKVRIYIMSDEHALHTNKIEIANRIFENTRELNSFHERKTKFVKLSEKEITYSGTLFVVFVITVISFRFFI